MSVQTQESTLPSDLIQEWIVPQADGKTIPVSTIAKTSLFYFDYQGPVLIIVSGKAHAVGCVNVPGTTWGKTITLYFNDKNPEIIENRGGASCNIRVEATIHNYESRGRTEVTMQVSNSTYQFSGNPPVSDQPIILETEFKISVFKLKIRQEEM